VGKFLVNRFGRTPIEVRGIEPGDVEALVAAVPTVARWRLATVPAHLTPDEVARFLDIFDRESASGQRGYAMARCLADMGLRAGEAW